MRTVFVMHVVLVLAGAAGLAASLVELSRWGAAVSGIALAAAGMLAIAGGRSAIAPRSIVHRVRGDGPTVERARRANAWVTGLMLAGLGLLATVLSMVGM